MDDFEAGRLFGKLFARRMTYSGQLRPADLKDAADTLEKVMSGDEWARGVAHAYREVAETLAVRKK